MKLMRRRVGFNLIITIAVINSAIILGGCTGKQVEPSVQIKSIDNEETSSSNHITTPTIDKNIDIIAQLSQLAPDIQWQEATASMDGVRDVRYLGKIVPGIARTGTGISSQYLVPGIHPKLHEALLQWGWQSDGPASMPGSDAYTYMKTDGDMQQMITVRYHTKAAILPSSLDEPIRFEECPCPYELRVFYSDPF